MSGAVTDCEDCPAGYLGVGANRFCTACAKGQYQTTAGEASCILCDSGQYQNRYIPSYTMRHTPYLQSVQVSINKRILAFANR
jgi:hypothetical protein